MVKKLLFFVLILLIHFPIVANEGVNEPNEFTERILLFRTKAGDVIYDGLLAHEVDRTLYFSAIDLFETLGFRTQISIDSNQFEAATKSPILNLELNWSNCSFKLNKAEEKYSCIKTFIYEDELFISRELAEKILVADIEYLTFKSEVRIQTDIDYPKISTFKRVREQLSPTIDFDPGYPKKKIESQTLKNIFFDQQFTWSTDSSGEEKFQYYTNASTDVLKHEIQVTSQGEEGGNEFTTWNIRRDYYGPDESDYISSYQFGNILIPTAEFIGGPSGGEGFYITNRDQFLINFGQREFEGNLRRDWEVELYVNDALFDRQRANESGRYRFQNVPVLYGENNFRLEFYGPLGERRTEFINNSVGFENLKKGQFQYEAGTLKDEGANQEALIQTSYGLTDNLSIYSGYTKYNLFEQGELTDLGIVGLNGYMKNFSYSFFGGQDFLNDGHFYSARTQFSRRALRLQFTYLDSTNFKSTYIGNQSQFLDKSYELNFNTSLFGRASVFIRAQHEIFDDNTAETTAIQNLVIPIRRLTLLFQNDLSKGLENKLDFIYTYLRNQFRLSSNYSLDEIFDYSLEYRNRFKRESSVSLIYSKNLIEEIELFQAGYQHRFNKFFLGLEALTDFSDNYSFLARLRTSFGYTSSQHKFQMSSDLLASSGNVCAKVNYDFNGDGVLSDIDPPLGDVKLRWVQGNTDYDVSKSGKAFLQNLPLYTPVDIQFLIKSLKDPQLISLNEGYRVHLQRGQCTELSFLVAKVFDFEGQVFMPESFKNKRLTVQLFDATGEVINETRTDSDGYFLFERQPFRPYYIRVKKDTFKTTPELYIINPFDQDSLEENFYFDVKIQ